MCATVFECVWCLYLLFGIAVIPFMDIVVMKEQNRLQHPLRTSAVIPGSFSSDIILSWCCPGSPHGQAQRNI